MNMRKNACKYTICIPVRNTIKYIRQCLDSVVNQSFHDFEVVVVDNGSTDGSSELLDSYVGKYPYFKVIHQENQGLLLSRRRAIEVAKGEYVCFLDSDDYLDLNFLSEVETVIEKQHCDIVSFSCYIDSMNRLEERKIYEREGLISQEEYTKLMLANPILNNLWLKVVKRTLFKSENTKLYKSWGSIVRMEGAIQTVELLETASKIYVMNRPLYYYRIMGQGLMSKGTMDFYRELVIENEFFEKSWIWNNLVFKEAVIKKQANTLFNIFVIVKNIFSSGCTYMQAKIDIDTIVESNLFINLYKGPCLMYLKLSRRIYLGLLYKKMIGLAYVLNKIM